MKKWISIFLLFISQTSLLIPSYATSSLAPVYSLLLDGGSWADNTKVVSTDRRADSHFGNSIAIFGDYAIVGAYQEDYITGNFLTNKYDSGAAYLYKHNKTKNIWELIEKISPNIDSAEFGSSVAIDENTIVIGAWDEDTNGSQSGTAHGAVYIYESYTQGTGKPIKLSHDIANTWFGKSVAISNNRIIVGSPWGHTSAGEAGVNGDQNHGVAYVYSKNTGLWTLEQQIISPQADTWFGQSVSISGNYLVIGSQAGSIEGAAYAYYYDNGNWEENGAFFLDGREGVNLANKVLVSDSFLFVTAYLDNHSSNGITTGSVSVYKRNAGDTSWGFTQKIEPSELQSNLVFGSDISISNDEKTLAIGDKGAGKVHLYSQSSAGWSSNHSVKAFGNGSESAFGQSVATTNSSLVVGDPNHKYDVNGLNSVNSAGAAYFFGY
ncbi:MAG: hypothetical protein GQ546_02395 [Gammaproteobacteria bacterium]|nr:hypothetical protein [Gammaproteobacteria bacterium]